ncbi:Hypothetical protein RAK1035_3914 [Roseovarius sp. AK1035]|nr:Hypothetical protein RAK1035_3914 [Roseovarius sp. AK1035]
MDRPLFLLNIRYLRFPAQMGGGSPMVCGDDAIALTRPAW